VSPPPPHPAPGAPKPGGVDRREALCTLLRGTCALASLGGCGGDWPRAVVLPAPAPATCPDPSVPGTPEEGWVEVPLGDHPALREPGGASHVRVPAALLDVVVVHAADGCFRAVWRTCTHGACEVDWDRDGGFVECPCHGSRFDLEGQVLQGPASLPLRAFHTLRVGEALFIHRPR
jgi:cytochrome b6-f complex iron-sulfur subunit